jgi:hypothetical protein
MIRHDSVRISRHSMPTLERLLTEHIRFNGLPREDCQLSISRTPASFTCAMAQAGAPWPSTAGEAHRLSIRLDREEEDAFDR